MDWDQSRSPHAAVAPNDISSVAMLAADLPAAARRASTKNPWPVIPGYELNAEVGRGGMGTVYRGHKRTLDRDVAIKVIHRHGMTDAEALRRFRRESRAAARLSHPNVVTVFDAGATDDTFYLVMEYVHGIDLQRLIDRSGPLLIEAACDYVRQAALGLQHAHEQGMVHRDIKPANLILIDEDAPKSEPYGRIKLLDLGLARILHDDAESSASLLTQEGTIVGTPDFIAPEQVENSHNVDIRADLYSLGCTLFYLLTGHVPFNGKTVLEKLDQHRWRTPRPVERLRRGIPPQVSAIVQKLMAKSPAQRFQTPQELAEALANIAIEQRSEKSRRSKKVETDLDICLDTLSVPGKQIIAKELDRLQRDLVQRIELDDLDGALNLAEAMVRLKPDDSLAITAREFVRDQIERTKPSGEQWHLEFPEAIQSVAATADGKRLAVAVNSRIHLLDTGDRRLLHALTGHQDEVRHVSFSPDGRRLLSAARDQVIRLWDVATGQGLAKFHRHTATVNGVAWLPSGQGFVSAGADRGIFVWDVDTGHRRWKLRSHTGDVKAVAVSADGRQILSASWDHTLRLWDLETGTESLRLGGSMNYFNAAALSPDGRTALGGGSDNLVHLYSLESGKELRVFEGHTNAVTSVAFCPDARRILSAGSDGELRLWDVETGMLVASFPAHGGGVFAAVCLGDGRKALTGGADRSLRLWKLPK